MTRPGENLSGRPAAEPRVEGYEYSVGDLRDRHQLLAAVDPNQSRTEYRYYQAADPFLGEHDFATFCRKGPTGSSTVRRVLESRWHDLGDGVLRYDITATAFCWQMVRSIVGTLVDVGVGKLRPGDMLALLRARDRNAAGRVGVPEGLCLWEVGY